MNPVCVVPSSGRAGRVTTVDVFPEGVIVVAEKQRETYEALQRLPEGWSILAIPDAEDGCIARARNTILRRFQGQDIVMLDDDYDAMVSMTGGRYRDIDQDEIRHLLSEGFRMVRELGTVLWGVNVAVDKRFYRPYTPLSVTSIVLGPFFALTAERPDDIWFDEDLSLKEDYDFSLRILHRYHRILRFNRYAYKVDHQSELGGVVAKRSMAEEVRQLHALQRRWGSDVVKIELHRSINPIIKVPLKGV